MVHEGIRLFCRSLEYSGLLQTREFVLEYGVVMHGEKRIYKIVLVGGIGYSRHLHELFRNNYEECGVHFGPVNPCGVCARDVLDGGLALVHLGDVQVAVFEKVDCRGGVAERSICARHSSCGWIKFAFGRI